MSHDETRLREKMMAHLDGELPEEEARMVAAELDTNTELRAEFERMKRLQNVTGAVKLKTPPDRIWEEYMNSVYRRVERGVGWILLSLGAAVLLSYGLWVTVRDLIETTELAWYMKGAIFAVLIGFAIIIVSVVREKLFMKSNDPYREIKR